MAKISPDHHLRVLLDAGQSLSLQQIQTTLNVGERQARRLIGQLQQDGLPILERRNGRHKLFYLPDERQQVLVPELRFDAAELRALAIAAKASQSVLNGTPHMVALNRAFEKLLEKARPVTYVFDVDESMQEWLFDDNTPDQIVMEYFSQLETAMDERRCVSINYLTAKDQRQSIGRKIDPYFFAKRNRAWLLVAYCHERKAMRNFSLTRISLVELYDDLYYDIPNDFDPENYFRASLGAINTGECYELRLLVEPDKAIPFRERQYHPTQQIEEDRPDGRLVVSYELEGLEEMRSFCQGWGIGITVLAPDVLRERLRQEAEVLLSRYS